MNKFLSIHISETLHGTYLYWKLFVLFLKFKLNEACYIFSGHTVWEAPIEQLAWDKLRCGAKANQAGVFPQLNLYQRSIFKARSESAEHAYAFSKILLATKSSSNLVCSPLWHALHPCAPHTLITIYNQSCCGDSDRARCRHSTQNPVGWWLSESLLMSFFFFCPELSIGKSTEGESHNCFPWARLRLRWPRGSRQAWQSVSSWVVLLVNHSLLLTCRNSFLWYETWFAPDAVIAQFLECLLGPGHLSPWS